MASTTREQSEKVHWGGVECSRRFTCSLCSEFQWKDYSISRGTLHRRAWSSKVLSFLVFSSLYLQLYLSDFFIIFCYNYEAILGVSVYIVSMKKFLLMRRNIMIGYVSFIILIVLIRLQITVKAFTISHSLFSLFILLKRKILLGFAAIQDEIIGKTSFYALSLYMIYQHQM